MKTRYTIALALGGLGLAMYGVGTLMAGSGPTCSGHIESLNRIVNRQFAGVLTVTSVSDVATTSHSDNTVSCLGVFHFADVSYTERWNYSVTQSDDHQTNYITVTMK
jgi:hypothetical protein